VLDFHVFFLTLVGLGVLWRAPSFAWGAVFAGGMAVWALVRSPARPPVRDYLLVNWAVVGLLTLVWWLLHRG